MPTNPTGSGKEPAEGSRETVERELAREKNRRQQPEPHRGELAPGDEAAPGTPGTGEDICPDCQGSGKLAAKPCPNCKGSGRIIKAIGGA